MARRHRPLIAMLLRLDTPTDGVSSFGACACGWMVASVSIALVPLADGGAGGPGVRATTVSFLPRVSAEYEPKDSAATQRTPAAVPHASAETELGCEAQP